MLGFPGFGQGDDPLPSGDPVVPEDVAQGLFGQRISSDQTGFQRAALLSGSIERKVDAMLNSVLTSLAGAAISRLDNPGGAHLPGAHLPGAAPVTRSPVVTPTPPAPKTTSPTPPTGLREGAVPPSGPASGDDAQGDLTPSAIARYKEGLATGQGLTMGGVAKSAIGVGARYFSDRPTNWQEDPETGVLTQKDSSTGEVIGEPVAPGDPGYRITKAKIAASTFAVTNLSSMAKGGGAVGRLGMVASKAAGPIGIAVGTGLAAGHFLEKQHEEAAQYRSAFGETGTGVFAAQDRFGEFVAGLQGFGSIGGDRARDQYQQASAMGLRDARREQASDFAGDMFKRFGMDTAESMKIVEQTLKQGNVSLIEFGESITEVSRQAVEAGRSSKEAIADFVATQGFVAQNLTGGAASVEISQQVASIAGDLPRGLAESLGGAAGMAQSVLSQTNIQNVASLSGQDPTAAWWRAQNPDTAVDQALTTFGQTGKHIVDLVAGVMGYSGADLKRQVQELTGGMMPAESGPGGMYSIFEELAGGTEQAAGIMSMVVNHVVRFFGMEPDTTKVLQLFFEACLEGFGAEARKERRDEQKAGTGASGRSTYAKGGGMETTAAIRSNIGLTSGAIDPLSGAPGGGSVQTPEDEEAYERYVKRVEMFGGSGNAEVEALLNPSNEKKIEEAAGVDDLSDVRYRVKDPKGKAVDLSLAEILKRGSAYTSQISSGEAAIVNAKDKEAPPTSVNVVLELAGGAADVLRQKDGPTDEQRAGVPPSGSRNPSTIPRWGSN